MVNKLRNQFIFKTLILTAVLIAFTAMLVHFIPSVYFDGMIFLFPMFPVVSIIVHTYMLKAAKESNNKFNIVFMLSFLLKLFVYGGVAGGIFAASGKDSKPVIVIFVLTLYLIYTVFDVSQIVRDIKKIPQKKQV
ncbi:MAG: hypothetical protein CSB06_03470 [Bacteroidia bacterium]|nr:MAG: hypothetical protein CSB06_03470 [Bacteroidia bacterium]